MQKSKGYAERAAELRDYDGEDRVISSLEMDLALKGTEKPTFRVNSMLPTLDRFIEGFQGGELVTVSGKTKNGKTLFCQTMTVNFIYQTHFPLWFSFEVPARQFLSQFPTLQNFFMPAKLKAHAMDWLEERVMESFYKYGTRVVFIDHLHFLFEMARSKSPSLEIGSIIRRLKGLAVEHEFIIFLLCHTRKVGKDDDPGYDSIRDSSLVAQESDCVLMIRRLPEKGDNAGVVRIEFHRRTGVMEKTFPITKRHGVLVEQEVPC